MVWSNSPFKQCNGNNGRQTSAAPSPPDCSRWRLASVMGSALTGAPVKLSTKMLQGQTRSGGGEAAHQDSAEVTWGTRRLVATHHGAALPLLTAPGNSLLAEGGIPIHQRDPLGVGRLRQGGCSVAQGCMIATPFHPPTVMQSGARHRSKP